MLYKSVHEFLQSRPTKLCVLATANTTGQPQAAVLLYTVMDDLSILLSTHTTSRKWKNLQASPKAAITVGFGFEERNVQLEGLATCVTKGDDFTRYEELYFSQHPEVAHFKGLPETAYVHIKPTWIRLSDYTAHPMRVEEQEIT